MNEYLYSAAVTFCGVIAAAGIIVSTTNDLGPLTAIDVPSGWQIPALIVVGLLAGLALPDLGRMVVSVTIIVVAATLVYSLAIALPGLQVERSAVRLLNRGLVQGLFAFVLIGLFVVVGAVVAVLINSYAREVDF